MSLLAQSPRWPAERGAVQQRTGKRGHWWHSARLVALRKERRSAPVPTLFGGRWQRVDISKTVKLGFPIWFVVHDRRGLFFVILVNFVPTHSFTSPFSSPPTVFSHRGRCFDAIVDSNAHFLLEVNTPPPLLPWFSCESFHFSFIQMPLQISAVQSVPKSSGTTLAAPQPPPSERRSSGNGARPSPRS